jgi:osmoprotectant transport system substrate-binding protein
VRRLGFVLLIGLLVAACATAAEQPVSEPGGAIRVGAFEFGESEILAELYAQALERRGLPVHRLGPIGSREVVEPALELGLIDVVPEYAGTMLSFVTLGTNEPTADSGQTLAELRAALEPRGMVALRPATAQNRNSIVVTTSFAAEREVRTISDLVPLAADLTFGGPSECPERYFCLVGLEELYGLEFGTFIPTLNSPFVAAALLAGEIDVGLLFSTDAVLANPEFTVLVDDRGLQPAENILPVVREEAISRWGPALKETLDAVSARLETDDLVLLNSLASGGGMTPADIALTWLVSN